MAAVVPPFDTLNDICLGCLVGGMIGDAAGATLEFSSPGDLTDENIMHAMTMPGGGKLNVGPGQVTDDGELMMSLAAALTATDREPLTEFPLIRVSKAYADWHRSFPFDCGGTCGRAFGFAKDTQNMMDNALRYNQLSEANGALMRFAPLSCWAASLGMSPDQAAEVARKDARLSHPSQVCQDANAVACVALTHLLCHPKDIAGAVQSARSVALMDEHHKVRDWLELGRKHGKDVHSFRAYLPECRINVGHVKHAIVLIFALLHLRPVLSFESAIFEVLRMGGDTDTNACICGYFMGAFHGFCEGVPRSMWEPVLRFDCTEVRYNPTMLTGYERPAAFKNLNVVSMARKLSRSPMMTA